MPVVAAAGVAGGDLADTAADTAADTVHVAGAGKDQAARGDAAAAEQTCEEAERDSPKEAVAGRHEDRRGTQERCRDTAAEVHAFRDGTTPLVDAARSYCARQ